MKSLIINCSVDHFYDPAKEAAPKKVSILVKGKRIFVDYREVEIDFSPDCLKFTPKKSKVKGESYRANGSLCKDRPRMIPARLYKIISLFIDENIKK
jgi:hypothetical protein